MAKSSDDGGDLRFREFHRYAAALAEAEQLPEAAALAQVGLSSAPPKVVQHETLQPCQNPNGFLQEELDFGLASYGPVDQKTHQCRTWLADLWLKMGKEVRADAC